MGRVDQWLRGALKDYLQILQSVAVIVAVSAAAYTFVFAPVEVGTYRTEKDAMGWSYHGDADSPDDWNFAFVLPDQYRVKPGTVLKVRNAVPLRVGPRTPFLQFLGTHNSPLGLLRKGEFVCVRDTAKTGFNRLWLYVQRSSTDNSAACK